MPQKLSGGCSSSQAADGAPALQVIWDSQVVEACGNDKGLLAGLKVQNVHTKEVHSIEASTHVVHM